jgi:HEAT repeat protein
MPFVKSVKLPLPTPPTEDERRASNRDCSHLEQQLSDPDPAKRRWAARDLADCPESAAALLEQLQKEQDKAVREIILTTLTRLGTNEVTAGMIHCLRSEDAALRNEAIEAMKLLPGTVAPIMSELLKDADSDVRIFAVNILESLRHPHVEIWLRDVIERDHHVNVCATAVDLLVEVGTIDSQDALENLSVRFPNEPYIRFAADLALKRIRST